MKKLSTVLVLAIVVFLSAACGSEQSAAPTSTLVSATPTESAPQQTSASATPALSSSAVSAAPTTSVEGNATVTAEPTTPATTGSNTKPGRDFSKINSCELVTDQEVATFAGGTVFRPSASSGIKEERSCTYEVTVSGSNAYETYLVYVEPADLVQPFLDEAKGEPVAGLGDKAVAVHETDLEQHRLLVLRNGDYGLEIIGPRQEVLVKIAQQLLSRL